LPLFPLPPGSWSQELWVSQPNWAWGLEGGSVTLPCSYNTSVQGPQVGSYRWEKEPGLKVAPGVLPFQGRLGVPEARVFLEEGRADLEIHDLRHYDAGTYRCLVTLHGAPEAAGNGTQLHVDRPGAGPGQGSDQPTVLLVLLVRALLYVLGIIMAALGSSLYYQRQVLQNRQRLKLQSQQEPREPRRPGSQPHHRCNSASPYSLLRAGRDPRRPGSQPHPLQPTTLHSPS
ncbi:natural cytotoxicity triggering receptor 3, partial [Alligator mississippiensis]|uniref:natural cytotoxicity triggering receptor 3 n=1 Tax=Alligator mississippiensis TaxID=8496 RepID=UPI002877AB92